VRLSEQLVSGVEVPRGVFFSGSSKYTVTRTYCHVNTVMSSCPAMLQLWLPYSNNYQLHAMACPTVGTLLSTTLMGGHKLANA
jgi:hypothetical protein